MKVIRKGSYVRIEKGKRWIGADFNDDGIIYVSYAEMPWKPDKMGTTERLGHLINPKKEYPTSVKDLIKVLKRIV